MMTLFEILQEDASRGEGSKSGREKYTSKEGTKKKGAVNESCRNVRRNY